MSSVAAQLGPLTERRWPTLVEGDCPPIGAGIEPIAEQLVDSASLRAGDSVLDVASGTGNVAIVAARRGCVVCAVDGLEALLEHGRERAATEGLHVAFTAGDAMQLPYGDASFGAVLSCMGVMFAPHHRRAAGELVRVCRPGGTIALANWTPAGFVGRMYQILAAHVPAVSLMWPPGLWGTEEHVRRLLGHATTDLRFRRRAVVFASARRTSSSRSSATTTAPPRRRRSARPERPPSRARGPDRADRCTRPRAGAVSRGCVGVPRSDRGRPVTAREPNAMPDKGAIMSVITDPSRASDRLRPAPCDLPVVASSSPRPRPSARDDATYLEMIAERG